MDLARRVVILLFSRTVCFLATGVMFVLPGCGSLLVFSLLGPPTLRDLEDVPEGVRAVCSNSSLFQQDPQDPLLEATPGTVIDELTGLEGCWGAFVDGAQFGDPNTDMCEFYRFDIDGGTLEYQVFSRDNFVGEVVLVHRYRLQIPSSDRILITLQEGEFIERESTTAFTVRADDQIPLELQITLDGDSFRIADSLDASPDFGAPHRAILVFHRFACPEDN